MSTFDALEADFFGDLPEDSHGVWEVFELVRLHYPELTDEESFERGYDYIAHWLRRGWIRVSDAALHPTSVRTPPSSCTFFRSAVRRLISAGLYFFGFPFASLPRALAFRFISAVLK